MMVFEFLQTANILSLLEKHNSHRSATAALLFEAPQPLGLISQYIPLHDAT